MKISFVDNTSTGFIPIDDRGLAYGDGCFTTALIRDGTVQMLEQHLIRLVEQSTRLLLPKLDIDSIRNTLLTTSQDIKIGIVKVIISAGSGGRGYSRQGIEQARVIISVHEYPNFYQQWQQQGIHIGTSQLQLGINPMLAGIKHLNRLEQVMVRAELDQRIEDDLLVTDINGAVVECCSANVFWLKNDQWYTPSLNNAGVAGLMRAKLLASHMDINIGNYTLSDLKDITAMFITNAILGIVPVKLFNDQQFDITAVKSIQKQFNIIG